MSYFSDRELGESPRINENINISVWNGLYSIIQQFVANNALAAAFPLQCPDNMGIYGCDEFLLQDRIKALIPSFNIPFQRLVEPVLSPFEDSIHKSTLDTYAVLDLIELIYKNLSDPVRIGSIHSYFNHYHLKFEDTDINKKEFKGQLNELFGRNGIAYSLNDDGNIIRILPTPIDAVIHEKVTTLDERLNTLLCESIQNILLPKKENRIKALERIWDAFERLKTYYGTNKKVSMEQVLVNLSNGNELLRIFLNEECKVLTNIGNQFQIRHFEKDKMQITNEAHIDYLYYRIFSFIHLFLSVIN